MKKHGVPIAAEKPPQNPPYPPGGRYGLVKRDHLTTCEKPPAQPPYTPGTRYGLVKRSNLG